eukprot:767994-Hanusia_phi.AAC.2
MGLGTTNFSHVYFAQNGERFVGVDDSGDIFAFHLRGNRFSLVGRAKLALEYLLYSSSERNEVIFATKDHRLSQNRHSSLTKVALQHPLH